MRRSPGGPAKPKPLLPGLDTVAELKQAAAWHNAGRYAAAETVCRGVLQREPRNADALVLLGAALLHQNQFDAALRVTEQGIALQPKVARFHNHLGAVLQWQYKLAKARQAFDRALALDPNDAEAHLNRAMVLLAQGDFAQGWQDYEWRVQARRFRDVYAGVAQPQWRGEPLPGETLLLRAEQGLGDTILFARFMAAAAARVGRLALVVPTALQPLLQTMPCVGTLCAPAGPTVEFARWLPIPSLPLALGTTLATLPSETPYLAPPIAAVAKWRGRLTGRVKVGLAWGGNPDHPNDARRSIPLARLAPVLTVPDVSFYCLQVGPRAEELASVPNGERVIRIDREIADFADTAAAIEQIDIVISVDTAVANLAGALGRPVWVLLVHSAEWRWLVERPQSPWYPTARRFRQPRPGDWEVVVDQVRSALVALAKAG